MCEEKSAVIETIIKKLKKGNENFIKFGKNEGDVSSSIRIKNVEEGQTPYAVIVTCSDSRVPPEHIFSAGIGELFVIRTAGNVVGDFELGSIEYAIGHLKTPIVLVLGHNHCGAVAAAMAGSGSGYMASILKEIQPALAGEDDTTQCENLNIDNSIRRIKQSKLIKDLLDQEKIGVLGGKYHLESGVVEIFG